MCLKYSSTSTSSLIPVTLYLVMFVMIMIPSVTASGACFKCISFPRDTYGSTDGCSDPFDSQMSSHDMRQCPPGESCVKILGVYRTGQLGKYVMIRDCYRASYSNAGYIKDSNIEYYGDRIDGFMHVCTGNYCNKASGRINGRQKDTAFIIIIMSSASVSLLFFLFPPYFLFLNPKQ